MSIRKSFGATLIRKPGVYSISKVDQSGGAPLGDNGTLFIIGEAEQGAPGDAEGIKRFSSSQLPELIAEYGSGQIVDVAKNSQIPSKNNGIGGADEWLVWKTNSALQASLDVETAASDVVLVLKDRNWGEPGNRIAVTITDGTAPSRQKIFQIEKDDESEILEENPAIAQLSIQYTGAGTAATLSIAGLTENAKVLSTAVTGGPGGEALTISLKDYTIKTLAEFINAQSGWSATLLNTSTGSVTEAKSLDPQDAIDIKTAAVSLYRLQREMADIINETSALISAEIQANIEGIPAVLAKTYLSGGAKGASTTADFSAGLAASLNVDWNVAVPAISRDASEDITDGLTDASSTYDVDSVHAALDTHLRLRGSVKNRREAQGIVGRRDEDIADSYAAAQSLGSELVQMAVQDVLVADVDASLKWKQPHVMAALMAGIRLGTEIGEPLTHKFLNVNGIGHVVDPDTGIEDGNFAPDTDYEEAIDAGVTFAEKASGGWRVVVDNTTYGKDQSFVFNRGSVVEASQFIAKSVRETAELIFVGRKVSNGAAASIKAAIRSKLFELNDANITTASDDGAPRGFKEDTFVVQVQGNTAKVQVEVKPVQGLDFIFIEFTLGDITQSA